MFKYDYRQALTKDIIQWIINYTDFLDNKPEQRHEELVDWLYDELFVENTITGNGVSFYDSEQNCSEYISNNFDLLYKAIEEKCPNDKAEILIIHYENNSLARFFDRVIRCYLLRECIEIALEELGL